MLAQAVDHAINHTCSDNTCTDEDPVLLANYISQSGKMHASILMRLLRHLLENFSLLLDTSKDKTSEK